VNPWLPGSEVQRAPGRGCPQSKAADWTSKKVQSESDGEIFWKINTGRGAMPSWRHLPENDRWALVRYIRSLGAK